MLNFDILVAFLFGIGTALWIANKFVDFLGITLLRSIPTPSRDAFQIAAFIFTFIFAITAILEGTMEGLLPALKLSSFLACLILAFYSSITLVGLVTRPFVAQPDNQGCFSDIIFGALVIGLYFLFQYSLIRLLDPFEIIVQ